MRCVQRYIKTALACILLCLLCVNTLSAESKKDTVFDELMQTLDEKQIYADEKEKRILNIKGLKQSDTSLRQEYDINKNLLNEYRIFQADSAIRYARRNYDIARELNRDELVAESEILLSSLYSLSGLFVESENLLDRVGKRDIPQRLRTMYYESRIAFYNRYNNRYDNFETERKLYRDSLLGALNPDSYAYRSLLVGIKIEAGDWDGSEKDLLDLLASEPGYTHQYAMIAHQLAYLFELRNDRANAKKYYSLSAIADIKNAVKENASLRMLALIYYDEGKIELAYRLTRAAVEDAIFGDMQFRTLQLSELYSITNTSYLDLELRRKAQMKMYITLACILLIFLILAVIFVYIQMRRISAIKEELAKTNKKLRELNKNILSTNEQLTEKNVLLSESNHVKEEYIAHFFDLCSTYINKMESFRRSLSKKLASNQMDELARMLKSNSLLEDELDELYNSFDHIFLNLYPTFVDEFNALLIPEEQVVLKPKEMMNTELRIFALIRLGITDSVKIAAFLRYSLSTIYNYRTKARNKAAVSRDEFEDIVMKIGKITEK